MLLHDDVLDAGLDLIKSSSTKLQVVEAGSSALCADVTIDTDNFTGPANNSGSGGGRKIAAATHASTPWTAIAINASGSATKVNLKTAGSQIQASADITSAPKAVSSGDTVSVGSFEIIVKDAA